MLAIELPRIVRIHESDTDIHPYHCCAFAAIYDVSILLDGTKPAVWQAV